MDNSLKKSAKKTANNLETQKQQATNINEFEFDLLKKELEVAKDKLKQSETEKVQLQNEISKLNARLLEQPNSNLGNLFKIIYLNFFIFYIL